MGASWQLKEGEHCLGSIAERARWCQGKFRHTVPCGALFPPLWKPAGARAGSCQSGSGTGFSVLIFLIFACQRTPKLGGP